MKVSLYWPECPLTFHPSPEEAFDIRWDAEPRTVFWVGATVTEARTAVKPHLTARHKFFDRLTSHDPDPVLIEDELYDGRIYFLVGQHLDLVAPQIRVYPYSGMWNGRSPFLPIGEGRDKGFGEPDGVQISSLNMLRDFVPPSFKSDL